MPRRSQYGRAPARSSSGKHRERPEEASSARGLDILVDGVVEVIRQFKREGMTVLLVEQNARLALSLADRGYVMERGSIVLSDTSARLLANEEVRRSYLAGRRVEAEAG